MTKQELKDLADRQERSLEACREILRWAKGQAEQLHKVSSDPFLKNKLVPMMGQLDECKNPVLAAAFLRIEDKLTPTTTETASDDSYGGTAEAEISEEAPS